MHRMPQFPPSPSPCLVIMVLLVRPLPRFKSENAQAG